MVTPALAYARHNWPVFPVRPRGKEPLTSDGFKAATTDLEQVTAWWRETPDANIGHVPGQAGHLVIDVDGPEGEREARRLGLLAEPTLIAQTARGRHLYFRHPGGTIGNRRLAPGLDVRADKGYVLLPPSVHPSGALYKALGRVSEIRELPPRALRALQPPDPPDPVPRRREVDIPVNGSTRRRAYVAAAIEAECLELANTPAGNRNNRLNAAAFALARFAEAGEADPVLLADLLADSARCAGLPEFEIERTLASAFGARGVAV